jgi:hypothetical protein
LAGFNLTDEHQVTINRIRQLNQIGLFNSAKAAMSCCDQCGLAKEAFSMTGLVKSDVSSFGFTSTLSITILSTCTGGFFDAVPELVTARTFVSNGQNAQ